MDDQNEATEHLRAIRQMMEQTRRRGTEDNWIPFVIWGVGGFAAALTSQALAGLGRWDLVYIPWNVYWPGCLLVSLWLGRGHRGRPQAGGFVARTIGMTWGAIGTTMLLVSLAAWLSLLPVPAIGGLIALLAGAGCFATGAVLQERALYVAAAVWWIGGLAALTWPSQTFAIFALLFALGYLLPAYLMRRRQSLGELADAAAV
jgi:hypothetical protein